MKVNNHWVQSAQSWKLCICIWKYSIKSCGTGLSYIQVYNYHLYSVLWQATYFVWFHISSAVVTQSSEALVSLPLEYLSSEYEPGWKQEHSFKNTVQKYNNKKMITNYLLINKFKTESTHWRIFIQKQSSDNHFSRLYFEISMFKRIW